MKQLVMIFILALWLPLGVGFADHGEDYDGSQDPEAWFFDSILDENGNPFLDKHREYKGMSHDAFDALMDMNEKRFGCIKTEVEADIVRPPSYQLSAHIYSLMTQYYPSYKLQENRYLTFAGCMHHFCDARSYYYIDTVSKHIAIVTIDPVDIFSKEREDDGGIIYDFDNYYKFMFLLPDAPEEFIQKALEFAKNIDYPTNRTTEIFAVDCRKDEVAG